MVAEMLTQRDRILRHLQAGRSITPLEALDLYGCFALSQRIGELKRLGHPIDAMVVRNGRKQYARYQMRPYQVELIEALRSTHGG